MTEDVKEFRQEWREKISPMYETGGIYCIEINKYIVYIGESKDMRERIITHIWEMFSAKDEQKKYWHLKKARERGYNISFAVLENCIGCSEEERLQKEKEWITWFKPPLNTAHTQGMNLQEFYENVV